MDLPRPTVLFLVNGEPTSAMGIRAKSFAERISNEFQIHIAYRSGSKLAAILRFLRVLVRVRPALCYVLDMAFSGVIAAGTYRFVSPCRMVVDTGDAIYELSRKRGDRGPLGTWLTRLLESFALWRSDGIVVRSHPHQELLSRRGVPADVIPDGVDTAQFCPRPVPEVRRKYNLDGFTVVGMVGSIVWNSPLQMCYGWELVEAISQLGEPSVKGLVIGDGSGLVRLKEKSAALGVTDRIVFVGRVPYDDLPSLINAMDICLSTQTNDTVGQVRTTGKLPLYLACGRFVLASQVGEAARVLPSQMLLPYNGTKDPEYSGRLASRVKSLLDHPELFQPRRDCVAIAQTNFDYGVLSERLRYKLLSLLAAGPDTGKQALVPGDPGAPRS